ncbi:MAG TPA: alpha/beta hydrolase [Anaerolineae bacterium]|nr:alpha/beta hydrolase [Anaerolineae bacterium]
MIRTRPLALWVPFILIAACAPTATPPATPTTVPESTGAPAPVVASTSTATPASVPVSFASSAGETINGALYGHSSQAIILSNMDTNSPASWNPLVSKLAPHGYMLLTYKYSRGGDARVDDLRDALTFIRDQGATEIILIGASRGGVNTLRVTVDPKFNTDIIAIAVLSAPLHLGGATIYSEAELRALEIPKLLINSEQDAWANDTREMYELLVEPKEMHFYPGSAHGAAIFAENEDDLVQRLIDFVDAGFAAD